MKFDSENDVKVGKPTIFQIATEVEEIIAFLGGMDQIRAGARKKRAALEKKRQEEEKARRKAELEAELKALREESPKTKGTDNGN